ncbi:MAG TPA: succinate dehydrogenase iron-sulfur subunit [Thermomicrobiaceae bacterium]|nr:succinate dehydrogenase iron-sulfur subunit [Thermomicrobiaceae bacterium]
MEVQLRIQRYNPDVDSKPHYENYTVDAAPDDRVLDALNQIKWHQDGTLTFRRSCAHGVCGSDAMRINGRNRLACKTLIQDVGNKVTIEPLLAFDVIKDLVIDMEPFMARYFKIMPYLVNDETPPASERLQSPGQRELYEDTSKCILCAACTTACPIIWTTEWVGPAAIVNAHRFIFDSRDQAGEERLAILNDGQGVWRCRTIFNCTDACPRGIQVTRAIEQVKRTILYDHE